MIEKYAPKIFKTLNGVFCVYKPRNKSMHGVLSAIRSKLCQDLNGMVVRPPRQILAFKEISEPLLISDSSQSNYLSNKSCDNMIISNSLSMTNYNEPAVVKADNFLISTVPDLADHPLVVGPRYQEDDFNIGFVDALSTFSSGVLVMGIGHKSNRLPLIAKNMYMRVYHMTCELGKASNDFTLRTNLLQTSTYRHVTLQKIDKVLAAMQGNHQRKMFTAAGIDPQSQEAYEFASRGIIRPKTRKAGTVIYGMKCIHFDPPHFTLEIHSINEKCSHIMSIAHNLGLIMKSNAVCTGLRRIRYGDFNLQHSLLMKEWDCENIIDNIEYCSPIVKTLTRDKQILPKVKLSEEKIRNDIDDFIEDSHLEHIT